MSDIPSTINDLSEFADFKTYLNALIHSWLKTLTTLGFILFPVFFVLDIFMIPKESQAMLPRFGLYRALTTAFIILQFIHIKYTPPTRFSFLHGYFFTLAASLAIVLMTMHLGGFNSTYYAGLNLVIIAVNLLLPWRAFHSAVNGAITVFLYLIVNFFWGGKFEVSTMINNFYFMASTVIIAASINHVKHILVKKEFHSRKDLKAARDALWSEMAIAKRIQTALLPREEIIHGYQVSAVMIPADEVGGDYYDIFEDSNKGSWVIIGDVSGHGVESGLIMMMTQTSVRSMIAQNPYSSPSAVIARVNTVIKENIARLGVDRYMTITAISLTDRSITFAGKHQDIFIYRAKTKTIDTIETDGAWIGVLDDIEPFLQNHELPIHSGDIMLLFTDGITELTNYRGELFGDELLKQKLEENINLPVAEIVTNILSFAKSFQRSQDDDITLVVIKKL